MRRFYTCLSLCSAVMLTACASSVQPSTALTLSPALSSPCPPAPRPVDGTGASILRWGVLLAETYNDCRARHSAIVKAWPKSP